MKVYITHDYNLIKLATMRSSLSNTDTFRYNIVILVTRTQVENLRYENKKATGKG